MGIQEVLHLQDKADTQEPDHPVEHPKVDIQDRTMEVLLLQDKDMEVVLLLVRDMEVVLLLVRDMEVLLLQVKLILRWFNGVDQDRSGQIDANELQKALVNGNWSHFSEEACRMMVDMFDRDRSGQINVQEFSSLFAYIPVEESVRESIDRDRSGFIEQAELGQALQQMGYRFTPTFVQNLLAKYDSRTRKLTLDNFIVVCVNIKRLTDSFRARDREMRGEASMQYEDFIGLAMGAHK